MALNLIPVRGGSDQIESSFTNFLPTTSNLYSCVSTENHGSLYMGFHYANSIMKVYRLNLYTNRLTLIGDIPFTDLGSQNVGGILADDTFLYVSSMGSTTIRIFDIKTLSLIRAYTYSSAVPEAYGNIHWDTTKTNIVIAMSTGFLYFNTETRLFDQKTYSGSFTMRDFAVGETHIIGLAKAESSTNLLLYDIGTMTFSTWHTTSTAVGSICYADQKFYITQPNLLTIFDEQLEEYTTQVCPWGTTQSVRYTNETIFTTIVGSNRLYLYNIKSMVYKYMYLPWTVRDMNANYVTSPTSVNGWYFLPYNTLAKIGTIGSEKYNAGYIVKTLTVLFDDEHKTTFTYNPAFIKFSDTYMTMTDGDLNYLLETFDATNHIKVINVDKSDYKKIRFFALK